MSDNKVTVFGLYPYIIRTFSLRKRDNFPAVDLVTGQLLKVYFWEPAYQKNGPI